MADVDTLSMSLATALRHIDQHAAECDRSCAARGFPRGQCFDPRTGRTRDFGGRCALRDIGAILIEVELGWDIAIDESEVTG